MTLVQIDPVYPDRAIIARAAELLRAGGLVAFPTETVYGLGANALDERAVERIYEAKGRPSYNPLIVHIANANQVLAIATEWDDRAERLSRAFWPGPLTFVLPKRDVVPDSVTAGLPTVAVRLPAHPVARALLAAAAIPVAAPSANRSTQLSPTTGAHVAKSLGDAVDLILDAGPTPIGIESTVVDLTREIAVLLRPGTISIEQIESIIGPTALPATTQDDAARPSPGMLDRHYAPRATLVLAAADRVDTVVSAERGRSVGAVVISATPAADHVEQMPSEPGPYAARLFSVLHHLDDLGCDVIVVEDVPQSPEWRGIRDRLSRAAHR